MHWRQILGDTSYWRSLIFSGFIALATVLISGGIALLFSLRYRKALGGKMTLLYLPLTIPAIVMAFFVFQFLSKAGFLSRLTNAIGLTSGLESFPDLVNDQFGIGILLAHIFMATPFFMILFLQIYENERVDRYVQLARTLGCSAQNIRRRIQFPIMIHRAAPTLILYFIFAFGSYEIPLLLGSQSPQMISVYTIQKLQRFNLNDIPLAYTSSLIYAIFVLTIAIVLLRKYGKSRTISGAHE